MKKIIFFLLTNFVYAQINFFNLYKPYQASLCSLPNVYGLQLQINYVVVDINTAEFQVPIDVYWGVYDNLEVGIQICGISKSINEKIDKGLSDILMGIKYNFLEEDKKNLSPTPTISVELGVGLPVGDYKKTFGTGGFGGILMWLFEKQVIMRSGYYFNFIFNLGFKYNTKNPDNYRVGESFFYTFGSYFPLNENLDFSFGIKGINKSFDEINTTKVLDSESFKSYIFSGLTYTIDIYRKFFGAILLGLTEDSEDLIFNIGMMY
ncbi:MAG: transporter [Endomicrobiia bacterium]